MAALSISQGFMLFLILEFLGMPTCEYSLEVENARKTTDTI
jgi:hypothetical protein